MERTEYPAMLAALAPGQAVDVLNDRVTHVGKLNSEIADWLQERRRLEDAYASGLRRLARRPLQGLDLGVFSVPWSTLTNATDAQADSHASLASKIEVDVERPLREYAKHSREMQAMSTMQGNLGALAKDVESAQEKFEKAIGRSNGTRFTSASQELEHAQGQWESQAPYVFESLQTLDEARLGNLQNLLTQLQTHEVDQVEKDRVSAEQCLNILLNVEIADEIKTFSLKAVSSRPRTERPSRSSTLPVPPAASSPRPALGPTLSSNSANEDVSQRSGSMQEDEKKKGPLKGLKRLSTVMGRKKDRGSKLPSQLEPMAEAPETKTKSSLFGRRSKKEEPQSNELTPVPSASQQRPYLPLQVGSEAFEPASLRDAEAITPASARPNETNGIAESAAVGAGVGAGIGGTAAALNLTNGSHANDLAGLEPPPPSQQVAASPVSFQTPTTSSGIFQPTPVSEPQRDAEGFSVPSNEVDPITRAQQEAAADNAALQYNVNIRDAPIAEEKGPDADAALASMQSKLQMQAPPPQRRAGTVRGRRDNRNSAYYGASDVPPAQPTAEVPRTLDSVPLTASPPPAIDTASPSNLNILPPTPVFNPTASTSSAFSTLPSAQDATSPFKPVSRALTADAIGDNQSIRSGKSLSSTTSQGHKHPDLNDTGLNVSILETVSARFESGKVVASSLIGEIALAYHAPDFSTPFGTDNIKLHNFSSLEKVAPNPAFVNPSVAGRDGEYAINLAGISKTQIAFKYQARTEDSGVHAPLLVTPAFKIEANQASIIVSYALNPSFHITESVTLHNVMLALTLEGAKASGCQSKPVGTFSKEKNMIFWQLGDITLRPGAAPEKLLARFATESEAKTGSIEARWEISGEQATALGSGLAVSVQQQPGASDGADPFADESAQNAVQWKSANTVKKVASGNYSAK